MLELEFDDTFSTRYTGKNAIIRKLQTRIKHTTSDIPYYERGVDVTEFTYGNPMAAIKLAFRDFGPNVTWNGRTSRIQYVDVSIPYPPQGES